MEIWRDGVVVQATPQEETRLMAKRARQTERATVRDTSKAARRSGLSKLLDMGLSRIELDALFGSDPKPG